MDKDYNLWHCLSMTHDAISRVRQKELKPYNINLRQSATLTAILTLGDGATPVAISRWIIREINTVSELFTRMERQGLVSKSKDLENKRQKNILLTEKGLEAYNQSRRRGSVNKIMSCLSDEERQQLKACLKKLCDKALEELGIDHEVHFPL